ncbi:hypothetical protein ACLKA7_013200 [Drosophila subpalustris]
MTCFLHFLKLTWVNLFKTNFVTRLHHSNHKDGEVAGNHNSTRVVRLKGVPQLCVPPVVVATTAVSTAADPLFYLCNLEMRGDVAVAANASACHLSEDLGSQSRPDS